MPKSSLPRWVSPGQGAAISLTAEHEQIVPATFVGLGERGKRAETVADEAVAELLAFEAVEKAAVDPHSADQILLPLAFAPVAVNSLSAKSPSTSAPTPKPSAPFSTGPSRSKSQRRWRTGASYTRLNVEAYLDRETSRLRYR